MDDLAALLDLAALERCGVDELGIYLLLCGGGNLGSLHCVDGLKQLCLGGIDEAFLLGAVVDDHKVLVGNELGHDLVDCRCGDGVKEHLGELQLGGGLHVRSVVEEVADERAYELGVLAAVCALCPLLVAADDLVLCTLDLAVCEAVAFHLLNLRIERFESGEVFTVLESDVSIKGLAGLRNLCAADAGSEERGSGLGGNLVEALAHDIGNHVLEEVGDECHVCICVLEGDGFALPEKLDV